MNPNTTIRPWILACGKQFGVRNAFHYRWPDHDNKPDEIFCTYNLKRSVPEGDANPHNLTTASGNNAVEKGAQSWLTTVEIDMYNSQNGLYELSSFCVALQHHQSIMALFEDHAGLVECSTEDMTEFDDEEINYKHRLTCVFRENVQHTLTNVNGAVDTIRITLDDGTYHHPYDIDDSGYSPT